MFDMKEKKILHLTLKKKWFDMILSGEKKEEYRTFGDYWLKRLSNFFETASSENQKFTFKQYDIVRFRHGYASNAPTIDIECKGISSNYCRPEWSDNAQGIHIIISLGNIISTDNLTN